VLVEWSCVRRGSSCYTQAIIPQVTFWAAIGMVLLIRADSLKKGGAVCMFLIAELVAPLRLRCRRFWSDWTNGQACHGKTLDEMGVKFDHWRCDENGFSRCFICTQCQRTLRIGSSLSNGHLARWPDRGIK